ncbi:MAG: oligosaccharide flippase family protein [Bacteroidales bacterium]
MKNKYIHKLVQSEFVKNSTTLLSSNVIAQIIAITIYPIVTRIYSPDDFGEFSLFLTIAGILSIISTGRYESAILLPKNESKAIAVFQLCIKMSVIIFIILLPVSVFFKNQIAQFFGSNILQKWLPLLPVLVLLSAFWQSLNFYLIRFKKFKKIGFYNISQSTVNSAFKVGFGIFKILHIGLILSTLLGQLFALFTTVFISRKLFLKLIENNKLLLQSVRREYIKFPLYEMPHAVINMLSGSLPILLLSTEFSLELIGFFSLGITLGFRPINVFCSSIYQVLFQKITQKVNNNEIIIEHLFSYIKKVAVFILPLFVFVFIFSNEIFELLFGKEWRVAGTYFKLMLPWFFVVVFTSSLSFIPKIFQKQKYAMFIEIIYIILRIVVLYIGLYNHSFYLAILLFCSVSVFMLTVQLIWFLSLSKKYELQRQCM